MLDSVARDIVEPISRLLFLASCVAIPFFFFLLPFNIFGGLALVFCALSRDWEHQPRGLLAPAREIGTHKHRKNHFLILTLFATYPHFPRLLPVRSIATPSPPPQFSALLKLILSCSRPPPQRQSAERVRGSSRPAAAVLVPRPRHHSQAFPGPVYYRCPHRCPP